MPPPIVPAPTTAARRIGMRGVSFAMPGTLATSRSAKKTWMSAFDWSENRHSRKSSASRLQPSANGSATAASTASMALSGAIRPRAFFFTCSRTTARIGALAAAVAELRRQVARLARRPPWAATSRAKATAPGSRSPSMSLSRMPARQRVGGADRFAAGAHLRGLGHAGQPRQPLRAARAGDEPELDLRLADLGVRRRPRGSGRPSPTGRIPVSATAALISWSAEGALRCRADYRLLEAPAPITIAGHANTPGADAHGRNVDVATSAVRRTARVMLLTVGTLAIVALVGADRAPVVGGQRATPPRSSGWRRTAPRCCTRRRRCWPSWCEAQSAAVRARAGRRRDLRKALAGVARARPAVRRASCRPRSGWPT